MKIEFGQCAALYGCVGRTAVEIFADISKMRCSTTVVMYGSTSLGFADVAVVDTVRTLIACKPFINSRMFIVVCDSAPNIASLKHVTPFDYEGDIFSNFTLKKPPKSVPMKLTTPIPIETTNTDIVRDAVYSIVTDSLLTYYNALTAKMNNPARRMMRAKMCDLLLGKTEVDDVAQFIQSLALDGDEFITKLRSRYFNGLKQAIYYNAQGHTLEYCQSKFGIKDSYEISYFVKMLRSDK